MKPFIGLLKKEILISRFWYITWLVIILLFMSAGIILAIRVNEPSIVIPVFMTLIPLHMLFMPIMVYSLLRVEGKTQLWLYNPQSSVKLLLAKISVSFIFQVLSQLLVVLYALSTMKWLASVGAGGVFSLNAIVITNLGMLAIAFLFSVWVIFLWTIYHSLGRFPAWKNFRWLAVLIVIFLYNLLEALFIRIHLIESHLFGWSQTTNAMIAITYDGNSWVMLYEQIPIPILPVIFYSLLSLLLFLVACKLLDKKVEV